MHVLVRRVRCGRSFIACLLLTLWLPATLHCDLEAAGWFVAADCHAASAHSADQTDSSCETDSCHAVESGAYKPSLGPLKLHAPALIAGACCFRFLPAPPDTPRLISPQRTSPPPELAPSWQFVARAAPQPRAPETVS